jgi:hypothetical protein
MFVTYLNPAPSDKAQPDPLAIEDLPPVSQVPADVMTAIAAKSELILVRNPKPLAAISSPLNVSGVARSGWFFEGSFPVTVTDWNGLIIGEGFVTAQGDWMTTEFVPFTGEIVFTVATDTPYRRGTVIFQKDNPSGLPENDDALEIPVNFE